MPNDDFDDLRGLGACFDVEHAIDAVQDYYARISRCYSDRSPVIRPEVARVAALAPLPAGDDCSDELIMEMDAMIRALPMPITDEEALALLDVLATPDRSSYYGAMWTLVHAVESAPHIPPETWTRGGPWFDTLRTRAKNAGYEPPAD